MELILNLMDSHKNYQESKVKGTGTGIFPEWLSNISIFAVVGPGIPLAGAAAGELICRKIKREIWNSSYIKNL